VRVRATDADGKLKNLPAGTTDEFGDFQVAYEQHNFPDNLKDVPELFVLVEDAKGALLQRSEQSVRFAPGRAEFVQLTLGERSAEAPKPARATRQRSTSKRSPRTRKTK
jgi:hypothetical protein